MAASAAAVSHLSIERGGDALAARSHVTLRDDVSRKDLDVDILMLF